MVYLSRWIRASKVFLVLTLSLIVSCVCISFEALAEEADGAAVQSGEIQAVAESLASATPRALDMDSGLAPQSDEGAVLKEAGIIPLDEGYWKIDEWLVQSDFRLFGFNVEKDCFAFFRITMGQNGESAVFTLDRNDKRVDNWTLDGNGTVGPIVLHAGYYKIHVMARASGQTYFGSIGYMTSPYETGVDELEWEPNGSIDKANDIVMGSMFLGSVVHDGIKGVAKDTDYYRFTVESRRRFVLVLSAECMSDDFEVRIVDANDNVLSTDDGKSKRSWGGKNVATNVCDFKGGKILDCGLLGAGTYYLRISNSANVSPGDELGTLIYSFVPNLGSDSPLLDTSCALLRNRGDRTVSDVWACSASGEAIAEGLGDVSGKVTTLFIDYDVKSIPSLINVGSTVNVNSIGGHFPNLQRVVFKTATGGYCVCEEIGTMSFAACQRLEAIEGLESTWITRIKDSAFQGCSSLRSIVLPATLGEISSLAFKGCSSMETIELPESVGSIGQRAFEDCTSLNEVTIKSKKPVSIDNVNLFYNTRFDTSESNGAWIYVQPSLVQDFKAKAGSFNWGHHVKSMDGTTPERIFIKLTDTGPCSLRWSNPVYVGDTATVEAYPIEGFHFVGWFDKEGKLVSTDAEYTFVVEGPVELEARIEADEEPKPDPDPEPQPGQTATMLRLYNPNSGEHFYTASAGECDHLVALGWTHEGVGWVAPTSGDPVFRLYNPNAGDHHYTTDEAELGALVRAGWVYEGIGWYSDQRMLVPVYREYNPNALACNHNYTPSKAEHEGLVALGWKDEGVAWYAASAA